MNAILKCCFLILLTSNLNSCSDQDLDDSVPAGEYSGTFEVTYPDGTIHDGPVTVTFNTGNTYSATGNEDYYPAGGSGSYSIADNIFTFKDENFWTANFDWGLILSGEYTYTYKNKQLILTKGGEDSATYVYTLNLE
ncbi:MULTISPECIES: hypothetical protein [unclassified Leeuwenhoekiella]|uniref:hypothetical protein n=1 Tax=unclassified Leeuwenhoekiella TaxID=2615029 RepID=UPI000C3C6BF5|nr:MULTISPECIES: hypothetical protein [unclassified Leeuwenhoekiella]MAW96565.1 hypothetical protein [Leeuwenhoekiella sp.]MBA81453.1 hypothetical protein [Leeuwenhoekiella sp.]|tara:strand:+ start:6872 stop:7282 length:411 start_codon:yes stop_codon:yes gene_type:complete